MIIPTDITRIGEKAFAHATSLKTINSETDGEIVLWQGLTEIGDSAFQDCPAIVSADLEVGIGGGVESSDLLKIKGMTATEITLPTGMNARYSLDSLFFHNTTIQKVIIPTDITRIGEKAFAHATSLHTFAECKIAIHAFRG